MATLEQNIEKVGQIFQDIGEAINEMYANAYYVPPVILNCKDGDCKDVTPPDKFAELIRQIPQDLSLDPTLFSARIEHVE